MGSKSFVVNLWKEAEILFIWLFYLTKSIKFSRLKSKVSPKGNNYLFIFKSKHTCISSNINYYSILEAQAEQEASEAAARAEEAARIEEERFQAYESELEPEYTLNGQQVPMFDKMFYFINERYNFEN